MLRKIFISVFVLFFFTNSAIAQNAVLVELTASVSELAVGDTFQVSIKLKNASIGSLNIGNVVVPGIENFQQQSSSQSTQVQMINGATTAVTETVLTLVATKEGEFSIGPIIIDSGGVSATSNTISVRATKATNKSFFASTDNKNNTDVKSDNDMDLGWLKNVLALVLLAILIYALKKQRKLKKGESEKERKEEKIIIDKTKNNLPATDENNFFEKAKKYILDFIENKYRINTESQTSQEISEELSKKNVLNFRDIIKALKLCDQGSFARSETGKEEILSVIKNLK